MQIAGYVPEGVLAGGAQSARMGTDLSLSRLWASELAHDPFLPLAFAGSANQPIGLGSAVAIAFARTPWATAVAAWDVARVASARVTVGLGTQVRAHVRRRFGAQWEPPVKYLRDYIGAIRAIWDCWQRDGRLEYEGEFFQLNLIAPPFNPGPADGAIPQVHIGGVNESFMRLAGEIGDGFIVHGFHSRRYIEQTVIPAVRAAGRDVELVVPPLMGVADTEAERSQARETLRRQVAFYASTPSYVPVLAAHGWEDLNVELGALAKAGRWEDLAAPVDDEVLDAFGVTGTPAEVGEELQRRYAGLADEVAPYLFVHDETRPTWERLLEGYRAPTGDQS